MADLTPQPGNVCAGYYYVKDVSTQTTDRDFFLLEHTQDAATQTNDEYFSTLETKKEACTQTTEEDFDKLGPINSTGNNFTVTSDTYEQKRKRNASGDQIITHVSGISKRSRTEINGISDAVSTFSEQSDENPDACLDRIPSSRIASCNSPLADTTPGFPFVAESHSHNQEKNVGYLLMNRTFTPEQIAASNMTLVRNENPSVNFTEFGPFGINIFPIDKTLAFPGSSWSHENIRRLNINPGKFPNMIPLKPLACVKKLICRTCKREIVRNDNECTGRNSKLYCECKYMCNICGVRYREESSHEIEHTCNVCQQNFQCKTQMEDHYLVHETHHLTYCSICCRKLDEHIIKKKRISYKCCQISCPFVFEKRPQLRHHLYTHSNLQLFKCEHCVFRFTQKAGLYHHSKYLH